MVELTGFNNGKFILNSDHIEKMEEVPETIITLVNGKKYIVIESISEVVEKIISYKSKIIKYGVGGN